MVIVMLGALDHENDQEKKKKLKPKLLLYKI